MIDIDDNLDTVIAMTSLTSKEAELSVIRAVLYDKDKLEEALAVDLKPDHFGTPELKEIYQAITELHAEGKIVSVPTALDKLKARATMKDKDYRGILTEALDAYPAGDMTTWIKIIVDRYNKRIAYQAIGEAEKNLTTDKTAEEIIDILQSTLLKGVQRPGGQELEPELSNIDDFLAEVERRKEYNARGKFTGLTTNFKHLDEVTLGLQPGTLWIIGARPSLGKTTLLKQLCDMVAMNNEGTPILFISYEQSRFELALKSISRLSGVNSRAIQKGRLTEAEETRINKAVDEYSKIAGRIYVYEATAETSVGTIEAQARRIMYHHKADKIFIAVDYLQLIPLQNGTKYDTDKKRVDMACSDLKRLARALNSPVVAISSLNRPSYVKGGKADLSSFKESGGVEYTGDIACTLEEDPEASQTLTRKNNKPMRTVALKIHKNRNGERAKITFNFDMALSTFEEVNKSDLEEESDTSF